MSRGPEHDPEKWIPVFEKRSCFNKKILGRAIAGAALVALCVAPARAETIRVEISKLVYAPAQISAHVGDTIEWVNADIVAHTATAKSKEFDVMIAPNKAARQVLTKAGAFDVFCRFHPNMTARLDVAPK